MLRKKYRLTRQQDFRRLKRRGRRGRSYSYFINWFPNRLPHSRFGFIASKKMGNAVQRNRGVRLLREAIRLNPDSIQKGVDVVFVLKDKIVGKSYSEVEAEVKKSLVQEGLWRSM